ncbi:MAG TPA: hypothetical protein VER55_16980 [Ardenticatenaceae bacterium]|nr:hypothetical protein [Ardenticatenaceae bacterium]
MSEFRLAVEVLEQYRQLRYDPEAEYRGNNLPIATIYWTDEHPGGTLPVDIDEESRGSILRLIAARTELWSTGEMPAHLQSVWEQAQVLLPEWPGFQRLSLSPAQQEAAEDCFQGALAWFDAMMAAGAALTIEDKGGIASWSAGIDLDQGEADSARP